MTPSQSADGPMRSPRVDRTREAIHAAADACFREHGFDAATSAEIARRAGVADGTVFLHFGSKLGLLHAVTAAYYDRIQDEAAAVSAGERDPAHRLRALVDAWAGAMERDWDLIAVFVHRADRDSGELAQTVTTLSRRYTRLFLAAIDELARERRIATDTHPKVLRDMIFGTLEHTARGCVVAGRPVRTRHVASQVVDFILRPPNGSETDRLARIEAKLDAVLARES